MTASLDWATIATLWRRDCLRFFRQPSRLVGALGQPIIFWGIIGSGFAESFRLADGTVNYPAFFYGGVVTMVALFSSIFASVSVIEDRHQGFLLAVMAAPGARFSMVLGKCLGSATVAATQIAAFLLLAPLAGFCWGAIDWPLTLGSLALLTGSLSALGFAVAWWLDNVQAYHAVQMTLLVPAWVVSGAMFPAPAKGALGRVAAINPLSYAVAAVRHGLYGGRAPSAAAPASVAVALTVLAAFLLASLGLAWLACRRRD
jgi:ABC-type multidrug transport system permease subunit